MTQLKKPAALRVIFILNALKVIASFTFFFVFSQKQATGEPVLMDPRIILYESIAYAVTFGIMVFSILTKRINLLRAMFVVDFISSAPIKAYIGIAVAVISMGFSFTSTVKNYFKQQ